MTRSRPVLTGDYPLRHKAKALFYFFAPVTFLAFGIAWVDWYQGQGGGGNVLYYVGWLFVFIGIILFFLGLEHSRFKPDWLFATMVLLELYGWWNLFWSGLSLTVAPDGSYFVNGVALLTLGPLGGVLMVSATVFFATSILAIVIPVVVALVAPRDVSFGRC
jgi:hypothetical protein